MKGISWTNLIEKFIALATMRFILLILLISTLSSCSWISSRRSLFGESTKKEKPPVSVPQSEYNALKQKYEKLLEEKKIASFSNTTKENNSLNLMDELSGIDRGAQLAETVDVFGKNGVTSKIRSSMPASNYEIESQISKIKKANTLVANNRFDAALELIRKLESSPVNQIRVRAKFLLGEILFRQQEYDLAMQIYEEILSREAYSGYVLKVLGRLIVCSEKLKIAKKQEKYYSILHDFFEAS